jgi:hypothetical protein
MRVPESRGGAGKVLAEINGAMNTILRLLQFCLGACRHTHTLRERRKLHGVDVLHFVCENCGYAVPALQRTAREHQQVVEAGAIKPMRAHRVSAAVVDLSIRRGRRHTVAS